ncbi:hypothetical protein [Nitrospira sp. BLG_2]|uniref:hypothetical protein n=1 Tax=Nitrospira sp. BLG_2 TaxID=3397507 RepID=UPI003B9A5073
MNWRHKIELNQVINQMTDKYDLSRFEKRCPTEVKETLATEVAKAPPLARFADLIRKAKTIAAVNRILENVFNEADYHKVWCGI